MAFVYVCVSYSLLMAGQYYLQLLLLITLLSITFCNKPQKITYKRWVGNDCHTCRGVGQV